MRRVLDTIRGRSYEEALMILEYSPYRACELITKTLVSVRFSSTPLTALLQGSTGLLGGGGDAPFLGPEAGGCLPPVVAE